MTKMEELKKRVDLNTKECTKCTKNSTAYKKPHHPTCLYAKAWTPARKVVLDALTDWEKQSLNLPTKKKYVELGLLPRSIFKSRPPPRSTVARVETNVQLGLLPSSIFESRPPPQNTVTRVETNAVVGPVTNKLMATVTNDTRTAENNDLPFWKCCSHQNVRQRICPYHLLWTMTQQQVRTPSSKFRVSYSVK